MALTTKWPCKFIENTWAVILNKYHMSLFFSSCRLCICVTHRQTNALVQTRANEKRYLLPDISAQQQTKHTNKRERGSKKSPKHLSNKACALPVRAGAGLNVRFGWIVEEWLPEWSILSGSCWLKRWELSGMGCLAIKREEITPGRLHSSPSESRSLFWENMQSCVDCQWEPDS